jgi:hypothetical protein
MSTRINVTVGDGGLLDRNAQQTAANRQARVLADQRAAAEAEGVERRAADRIAAGLDPLTGLPASTPSSASTINRLDQEPAANRRPSGAVIDIAWLDISINSTTGVITNRVISGNGKAATATFESYVNTAAPPYAYSVTFAPPGTSVGGVTSEWSEWIYGGVQFFTGNWWYQQRLVRKYTAEEGTDWRGGVLSASLVLPARSGLIYVSKSERNQLTWRATVQVGTDTGTNPGSETPYGLTAWRFIAGAPDADPEALWSASLPSARNFMVEGAAFAERVSDVVVSTRIDSDTTSAYATNVQARIISTPAAVTELLPDLLGELNVSASTVLNYIYQPSAFVGIGFTTPQTIEGTLYGQVWVLRYTDLGVPNPWPQYEVPELSSEITFPNPELAGAYQNTSTGLAGLSGMLNANQAGTVYGLKILQGVLPQNIPGPFTPGRTLRDVLTDLNINRDRFSIYAPQYVNYNSELTTQDIPSFRANSPELPEDARWWSFNTAALLTPPTNSPVYKHRMVPLAERVAPLGTLRLLAASSFTETSYTNAAITALGFTLSAP